jgi:uncharacterized protein
MRRLDLPPFHLFCYQGRKYAFDIETSAVLELDAPAYEALSLRLSRAESAAIAAHLTASYGAPAARAVLHELRWLEENGALAAAVYTYDDRENAAYVQQLTGASTNKIELYLAEACNLRCRYCYVDANQALGHGLMPWEVARQAVDLVFRRAGQSDNVHITFFGGEPLLNKPVLRETIRYSQQRGAAAGKRVGYSMTTNATLLDDETIDLIKRYNFGLMISLDGPPEVHDRMRPDAAGHGSFDRAARNIKRLMARRRAVTVRCTLSNQCLDRPAIVNFLEELGFTRVAMSRCSGRAGDLGPYDIGPQESAVLKAQDDYFVARLFEQLDRGERIRFNPWGGAIRSIHDKENRRMRCGVGRGCTTVGIDGALYPCHRYVGMAPYVLGHVSTGIDQAKFAAYLTGYFETKRQCESCWAINLCGGYCPWYVSTDEGAFRPPESWWCDETRSWYEQAIWLYDTLRSRYPDYFHRLVGEEEAAEPALR